MTALFAMVGPLAGVVIGWCLHKRSTHTASPPTAVERQLDHVCEIDRCVFLAMTILHDYEKRLLVDSRLSENGSAAAKSSPTNSGAEPPAELDLECSPRREPLDGKTLLDIKREVDRHLRECTSALTRSTAVLDEETIHRAQELVDALTGVREALEEQEINSESSPKAVRPHVAALHKSRTCFLNTARSRLGVDSLSEETKDQIEDLTEHIFSPAQCPRPYITTGLRLPQEQF